MTSQRNESKNVKYFSDLNIRQKLDKCWHANFPSYDFNEIDINYDQIFISIGKSIKIEDSVGWQKIKYCFSS